MFQYTISTFIHMWGLIEIYRICIDSYYKPPVNGEILKIEWSRGSEFNQSILLQMEQWHYFTQLVCSQE